MKKFKKLTAVLAAIAVLAMSVTSFAAAFKDVPSDKYSWAVEAVESMANDGIIKGYEDGSFRPENTVTKLESLVLIARILGSTKDENATLVEKSYEAYKDVFTKNPINYGEKEVSYLLTKGIITEDELSDYIGGENASTGLMRYEIAILLTKALGAEEKVKENMISFLDYADTAEIPSHAKKYVEYVTDQEIMNGMGDNMFSPLTKVTRAQAAVVLKKVQDINKLTYYAGMITKVDPASKIFTLKTVDGDAFSYTISNDVRITFDGKEIAFKELTVGNNAVITLKNSTIYAIDSTLTDAQEEVDGEITSVTAGSKITLKKYNGSASEKVTYSLADNVVVTKGGASSSITKLQTGDYAKMIISGGKVIVINAESSTTTVKGTVSDIILSPSFYIEITDSKGTIEQYTVSNNVNVKKNTKTVSLSDIYVGDSVTLTLEYGVITDIVAVSATTTKTGIIEEIVISDTPSVTMRINGTSSKYSLARDAQIILDNADSNIYGLRLGVAANVTLSGDTITKISTSDVETAFQITGRVDLVNTSYGLMQLTYTDTVSSQTITRQIFVKEKAKVYNSITGRDSKLSYVNVGSTVSVVGTSTNGVFEASSVVIITE